ncbi:MAG: peptidoglycan DD-metalloendopeptidase family protein [Holosporales bacterium]|nr:peptidoglycan DD-metalloendopeptidase family protein [Holosporales bacterium]
MIWGLCLLVVRRSNFISICLLAIAVAISLTEYIMYSPSILPDSIDEHVFNDKDEEADEVDVPGVPSAVPEVAPKVIPPQKAEVEQVPERPKPGLPFKTSSELTVTINKGDTLGSVLDHLGFPKSDAFLASKALSKVFNLKNLKIGQEVIVRGKRTDDNSLVLNGLEIRPDYRYRIVVKRTKDGAFSAEKVEVPVKSVVRNVSGVIHPSAPDYSLKQCGVNRKIAGEALSVLGQVVNIRQSKHPIDFEFLCKDFYDEEGHAVSKPELMYASILHNGRIIRIYKFTDHGTSVYVDNNGVIINPISKHGSMLAQPLAHMRITSRYGMRIHPISGRLKGHTGIDLDARIGTPIRAAASGVVARASYYSGYGKYVRVAHSGSISTAYGHLSRIAVRDGQHVQQGQIIGYTGNTGYSHGPHLHYEVLRNGRPINPAMFVRQEPQRLMSHRLAKFNQFKKDVNLQIVGLTSSSKQIAGRSKKYS